MTLVPAGFSVPAELNHSRFHLRMLRATDAVADYEAVMESQVRLRAGSPNGWPRVGFTLEENIRDLERHEREFLAREAFAYTMLDADREKIIGCVYINPSDTADADVYLWVRDSRQSLTRTVLDAVDDWLRTCWPFDRIDHVRTIYYQDPQDTTDMTSCR